MADIQYCIIIMGGREVSRPYRVWFFAEGERFLSFCRCHRPRKRAALGVWCGWFKPQLEIRHAAALTTSAKHWHRQKAVFYVFVSVPPVFIHWTPLTAPLPKRAGQPIGATHLQVQPKSEAVSPHRHSLAIHFSSPQTTPPHEISLPVNNKTTIFAILLSINDKITFYANFVVYKW